MAIFYVNQAGSGGGTGVDLANAASMATLNGRINSAGDNIILNGTIITKLIVSDSGGSGNPITYTFASGAKFSKGTWNVSGGSDDPTDAAIYANAKNNITIDGAGVGIIECTSNGTGLATANDCVAISSVGSSSNWIIKNLIIQKIFVRLNGLGLQMCNNIKFGTWTGSNILIDNCTLSDSASLVSIAYGSGASTVEIKNCTGTNQGIGCVVIAQNGSNCSIVGILIHDNNFSMTLAWSGESQIHKNLIYCYANVGDDTASMNGLKVYRNNFSGFMGDNGTSYVYIDGFNYDPLIYDNLFIPSTNDFTGNGFIFVKGTVRAVIANNTWIGQGDGVAVGTNASPGTGTGLIIKNNVTVNVNCPIFDQVAIWNTSGSSYDYNDWYLANDWYAGTGRDTFAQWKTETGMDSHSSTLTPNLNGSYVPVATSAAIGSGTDMSAYYTTDKAGNSWIGQWGMGAFRVAGQAAAQAIKRVCRYLRLWGPAN